MRNRLARFVRARTSLATRQRLRIALKDAVRAILIGAAVIVGIVTLLAWFHEFGKFLLANGFPNPQDHSPMASGMVGYLMLLAVLLIIPLCAKTWYDSIERRRPRNY